MRFIVGRKTMTDLGTIMQYISVKAKIRVIKTIVFLVIMYGWEYWTLRKNEKVPSKYKSGVGYKECCGLQQS